MKYRLVMLASLIMALTGCTFDYLMSAQGWRDYIGEGGVMARKTVLVVDRSYADIGKDWAERSNACINNKQLISTGGGPGTVNVNRGYTAKYIFSKQRAELDLLEKQYGAGVVNVVKELPEGHFFFVADAIPISSNKTRIEMYHASNRDVFVAALSNWATGKNMGCPDLTRM